MNATKLNLISRIFQYLSIAVGVVLSILILMSGPSVADGKEAIEKFRESAEMNAAIYFILFINFIDFFTPSSPRPSDGSPLIYKLTFTFILLITFYYTLTKIRV